MQKSIRGSGVSLSSSLASSSTAGAVATFGVFQNVHINPFPVRAAIDIGTAGMISMTVGRVDAARNAVRDFMYQTQLPLYLMSTRSTESSSSSSSSSSTTDVFPSSFLISEKTRSDIRNKMRMLHGVLRRDHYDGLGERAAVISWPLCEAVDALSLAEELTREFKVDVRVLGKTFHVENLDLVSRPSVGDEGVDGSPRGEDEMVESLRAKKNIHMNNRSNKDNDNDNSLKVVMQQILRRRERRRERRSSSDSDDRASHPMNNDEHHRLIPPKQQMEKLAFLGHAAVSKCVAPQRMLVITEDPHKGLCVLGAESEEVDAVVDNGDEEAVVVSRSAEQESSGVLVHILPVDIHLAQHLLLTAVQRRAGLPPNTREHRSPNPVLREEFRELRHLLEEMIRPTLPSWVQRKSHAGGLICGSSFNGGVLNIAARVAQRTNITLEHLDTHAEMHYCGLTDVLLAMNYPDPATVLPNSALASALMRSLETTRVEYLPEVSIAAALLIQPSLWIYDRREKVRATLSKRKFFNGGSIQRTFHRPHARENPTAAPEASWQQNKSWNPLSYENSTKGT